MLQVAHQSAPKKNPSVTEHLEMLWRNGDAAALIDEMTFDPSITKLRLFGHDSLRTLMWRHNIQKLIAGAEAAGEDFKGPAIVGAEYSLVDLLISKSHTGGDTLGHVATAPFRQGALHLLDEGVNPMASAVYLDALMADAENQTLNGQQSLWHSLLRHCPPSESVTVKTGFKLLLNAKFSSSLEVIKTLIQEGGLTPEAEARQHSSLMPGGLLGLAISRKRYAAAILLLKEGFSLIGDAATPTSMAKTNLWPADKLEELANISPQNTASKPTFRHRI